MTIARRHVTRPPLQQPATAARYPGVWVVCLPRHWSKVPASPTLFCIQTHTTWQHPAFLPRQPGPNPMAEAHLRFTPAASSSSQHPREIPRESRPRRQAQLTLHRAIAGGAARRRRLLPRKLRILSSACSSTYAGEINLYRATKEVVARHIITRCIRPRTRSQ